MKIRAGDCIKQLLDRINVTQAKKRVIKNSLALFFRIFKLFPLNADEKGGLFNIKPEVKIDVRH